MINKTVGPGRRSSFQPGCRDTALGLPVVRRGGGLRYAGGIGSGKAVLQAPLQRFFGPAPLLLTPLLAGFLAALFGDLVQRDAVVRDSHEIPPEPSVG